MSQYRRAIFLTAPLLLSLNFVFACSSDDDGESKRNSENATGGAVGSGASSPGSSGGSSSGQGMGGGRGGSGGSLSTGSGSATGGSSGSGGSDQSTGGNSQGTGGSASNDEFGSTCGSGGPQGTSFKKVTFKDSKFGSTFYMVGAPNTDKPLPLLVLFHGDEGTTANVQDLWAPFWEKEKNFIIVIPQSPGEYTTWTFNFEDKAAFVDRLLDQVGQQHNVDVSRIYASGYSGGTEFLGTMSWDMHDTFAAINFSCGGGGWFEGYEHEPPTPECVFDARLWFATDDFMNEGIVDPPREPSTVHLKKWLEKGNVSVDFIEHTLCSGHCCSPTDVIGKEIRPAWNWMKVRTKCSKPYTKKCVGIRDLP